MSSKETFETHRSWEDLAVAFVGVVVMALTWMQSRDVVPGTPVPGELINAAVVGVLLLILGLYEMAEWSRAIEFAIFACGLWLVGSPFAFGLAPDAPMALWHYALGAVVLGLAALELWQDWDLRADQVGHHHS